MTVELRRSSEFSRAELAAVFAAAYEGYFVPFPIDESRLAYMIEAFDLDLESSVDAADGHRLIGLANLGRRGERAWIGGVGVVPSQRGAGLGELLTRSLLDRARRAGAREMALEVIVENVPAISLDEKLGFARRRERRLRARLRRGCPRRRRGPRAPRPSSSWSRLCAPGATPGR